MRDYVGCILRMIPDMTPWHLKPLEVGNASNMYPSLRLTVIMYSRLFESPAIKSPHEERVTPALLNSIYCIELAVYL